MTPHFSTKEALFKMVYGVDVMLPIEIDKPTWQKEYFNDEGIAYQVALLFT